MLYDLLEEEGKYLDFPFPIRKPGKGQRAFLQDQLEWPARNDATEGKNVARGRERRPSPDAGGVEMGGFRHAARQRMAAVLLPASDGRQVVPRSPTLDGRPGAMHLSTWGALSDGAARSSLATRSSASVSPALSPSSSEGREEESGGGVSPGGDAAGDRVRRRRAVLEDDSE